MNKIKRLQMGETLDFYTLSHDKIKVALEKVLEDVKYMSNAKRMSAIVRDYNEKPLDRAIRWIEWVLRHPNVNFTQSPVITLGYIVGNSLDVIAFSAIAFILQIYISFKLIYFIYKMNIYQRLFNRNTAQIHDKQQ